MNLKTKIFTLIYGKKVGEDQYGNKYYRAEPRTKWWQLHRPASTKWGRDRRWVAYDKKFMKKGIEASAVPAEWNIWLHYISDEPLDASQKQSWEKEFIANPTGTKDAVFPKNYTLSQKGEDAKLNTEIWTPGS